MEGEVLCLFELYLYEDGLCGDINSWGCVFWNLVSSVLVDFVEV